MTLEDRLPPEEVERIARGFARENWNGEVTEFHRIWLSCICEVNAHEVDGKVGIHQLVSESPNKFCDTIVERLFKLRISVKDKKVTDYWIEQPPPPPPQAEPASPVWPGSPSEPFAILGEPPKIHEVLGLGEPPGAWLDRQADRDLKKAKADYWRERAKRERRK